MGETGGMPSIDPSSPDNDMSTFLEERHLATLTVHRADGRPHVTPVGFTYEPQTQTARVITWADSWKAKHVARDGTQRAAICSVDGGRWVTLYGEATVTDDPDAIAEGVRRYAARYRQPKERDDRVVIEVRVDEMVGRA